MNSDSVSRSRRIPSLQGLRACGFVAIFLSHSVDGFTFFGAAGVSIFLVLSGFLMAYRYLPRESVLDRPSIWSNLRFALQKIIRLYPLHLLTLLLSLALMLKQPDYYAVDERSLPLLTALNCLLLQSWVPKSAFYFSLNSVSWYLSTALFTYFIFPWLLQFLRRLSGIRQACIGILTLIVIELAISLASALWGNRDNTAWFSLHWITYICPLSRAVDFAIGTFAGYLFLFYQKSASPKHRRRLLATFRDALLFLILFGICRFYRFIPVPFRYSFVYIVPSLLLVYSLAQDRSWVSSFLSRKPFQWIGNLSSSAFLIHVLAIREGRRVLGTILPGLQWYYSVLLMFFVTLFLSFLWNRLSEVLHRRKASRHV